MVFARCPAARLESASQKLVDLMRHLSNSHVEDVLKELWDQM